MAFAKKLGRRHFPGSNYLAVMAIITALLRHFQEMFNFSYQEHNSFQKIDYILLLCRILKLFKFHLIKIHIFNIVYLFGFFSSSLRLVI